MTPTDRPAEVVEFAESIPAPHRATFTTLQELIDELAPDSVATLKWGTLRA